MWDLEISKMLEMCVPHILMCWNLGSETWQVETLELWNFYFLKLWHYKFLKLQNFWNFDTKIFLFSSEGTPAPFNISENVEMWECGKLRALGVENMEANQLVVGHLSDSKTSDWEIIDV